MNENFDDWASQPDVCRCCLRSNGTWSLSTSCVSEDGKTKTYSEMLIDCFGITLSHLKEWDSSQLMCHSCFKRLKDACTFRQQVLFAEGCFNKYYDKAQVADPIADEERYNKAFSPKTVNSITDDIGCVDTFSEDFESDANPIIENNNLLSKEIIDTQLENVLDSKLGSNVGTVGLKIKQNISKSPVTKQISERKRVILTSEAILNNTNACPFRHHKSWFQCFYCTKEFITMKMLRTHILAMHKSVHQELHKMKNYPRSLQIDITDLLCNICKTNLTDVETMRRHLVEVHNKIIYRECIADYKVDASPYKCHICNQEFHVFRRLTTHLNEHYANYVCDICGKSFINSKRLKVHKRIHDFGVFPCIECGKVLKTKISKDNHMESVHSKRVIKCQICNMPMKHYNNRIKHMSEVHNITHTFECPVCGKEYTIKHYLATHMRQTHGKKNKKCPECCMAFVTNHGLKKHMLKHSGQKPYRCDVCCKSYSRSYRLREHMKQHDTTISSNTLNIIDADNNSVITLKL